MRKRKIRLIFIFLSLLAIGMLFPGKAFSLDIECIVIYPEKYQTAADNLKTFHESYAISPIGTELVTVESIYAAYGDEPGQETPAAAPVTWSVEAPDEITAHFPTDQPNSVLDILGYIQDTDDSSKEAYEAKLQYVVILGNSLDVPPSYYVYSSPPISGYNAWIPTDFFYSIVESGRLIPNYKVGRIPVKDQDDALDTGEVDVDGITDSLLTTTNHSTVWAADEWIDYTLKMTTGSGGYYTIDANTLAGLGVAGTLLVSGGIEQSSATINTLTETILTDTSEDWTPQAYQGYALRIMDTAGDDNGGVVDGTLGLYTIIDNGTDTITVGTAPVPAQQGAATQDPGALDFKDDTKTWGVNDWAGYALHITSDTMAGKSYEIASNTIDTLTCIAGTTLYGDGVREGHSYEILQGTFLADLAVAGDKYEIYKPGPFLAEGVAVADGNSYEIRDYRDDAIEMVNKIEEWHTAATWAWFQNVTLAAGQRYDTWAYWDEVATVDLINKVDTTGDGRTYLSGMTVNKAFHTDFTVDEGFTEVEIELHLQNTDTGFLYLAGLGDGDGFHFDDGSEMTAEEIRTYIAGDDRIPIVISCADYNAAFDSEIYSNSYPDDFSFGEAVVVSYDDNATEGNLTDDSFGGGIAYIGASRTSRFSYPGRSASMDSGRLTLDWPSGTRTYYMDELLQNVFKQYHRPPDLLGTIFANAIGDFVRNNEDEGGNLDSYEERALYGFTLLGDPALRIPKQPTPGTDHAIPTLTALDPRATVPDHNSMGMPVYEASANRTITIRITTDTNTDNVEYKLIDPENDDIHVSWDTALAQEGTIATPGTASVDKTFDIAYDALNHTRIFCLRVSAQDENLDYTREARLYFQVVLPFTTSTDVLLVDDDQQDIYRFGLNPSDETDLVDWYKNALNAAAFLNYTEDADYVVWDVDEEYGEITRNALDYYNNETDRLVIWFTGDDKGTGVTTIVGDADTADQYYLAEYLDGGGRLFLTGQDIGYDINGSDFFTDYLHATLAQDYIQLHQIDGKPDDPVTHIFQNVNIAGGGGAENQSTQSEIDPISPATAILTYDPDGGGSGEWASTGTAGLRVQTAVYKVVYFSFGFEGIDADDETYTGRYPIMQAVVEWLNGTAASIPPTVTSVSPLDGATDVLITEDISATFSDAMKTTTVDLDTFKASPVTTGTFIWSTTTYTNDTVTFTPSSDLAHNTPYTVTITTVVTDNAVPPIGLDGDGDGTAEGSPDDDYSWSFTTASLPQVSSASPTGTGVAVSADISVIFSNAMDTTATEDVFSYTDGTTTWDKNDGMIAWSNGNKTMTFYPTNNSAYSTSYTVKITADATDTAGYHLDGDEDGTADGTPADDYSWSFTTASASAVAATGGGGGGGCFIATSAYSRCTDEHGLKSWISTDLKKIEILQKFRDERLLTNPLGRAFVTAYYKVSPPIADFIRNKEFLKAIVRAGLRPLVRIAKRITP